MQSFVGTSGFQYPEWKGTFYPETMPAAKMLPYYAERFPTTEINYSFRRIPSPKTIAGWVDATPPGFRFTLKAPQKVTHFARLRDCAETMDYFAQVMRGLDEKKGAVLFQLPPQFARDRLLLRDFLASMPAGVRAAFEFRSTSWFDEEIYSVLREFRAALCLAESADLVTPREVTADFGYLRLRREDYTDHDIAEWADFIRSEHSGWSEVYIYFKHEAAGVGPQFAQKMISLLAPKQTPEGPERP